MEKPRYSIVEINKENYKGYLELYQLKRGINSLSEEYQKSGDCLLDEGLDWIINGLKYYNEKIDNNSFSKDYIELLGYEKIIEKIKMLEKQYIIMQMLKMKFPYVDCNISLYLLEKSLLKVRLLKVKYENDCYYYKLDFSDFENYLEIKQLIELLHLEKYNYKCVSRYDKSVPYVKIRGK